MAKLIGSSTNGVDVVGTSDGNDGVQGRISLYALAQEIEDGKNTRGSVSRKVLRLSTIAALTMIPISVAVSTWSSPSLAASKFIDANLEDLRAVGWPLNGNLDNTNWAQAARAANEFCKQHGALGGTMNGHQVGVMRGVTCVDSKNATFIDATLGQLRSTKWPLDGDINSSNWAQAARSANEFCKSQGFLAGWMNGHQRRSRRGVLCVNSEAAQFIDGNLSQFRSVGWPIDGDLNFSNWAQAARAANEFCKSQGFVGGRLNGHQAGIKRGVICLKS
jgi:hypothetical protein